MNLLNYTLSNIITSFLPAFVFIATSCLHTMPLEQAYLQLAQTLQQNDPEHAHTYFVKTIECNPHNSEALFALGMHAYRNGFPEDALFYFLQCCTDDPTNEQAFFYTGVVYAYTKQFETAITYYQQAITLNPANGIYHFYLGIAFYKQNNYLDAETALKQALTYNKELFQAHLHLAYINRKKNNIEEALLHCTHALALDPTSLQATLEQGTCLNAQGDYKQAEALYLQALEHHTDNNELLIQLGNCLRQQKKYTEALTIFTTLIEKDPSNYQAFLGRAYTHLANNTIELGWQDFASYNDLRKPIEKTVTSLDMLPGSTVLIRAEWEYEEMIQLARYTRLLKEHGATVILQTPNALTPLFANNPSIDYVINETSTTIPHFDYHIALTSLPALFKITYNTVPTPTSYLTPDNESFSFWKQKLASDTARLKIGLCLTEQLPMSATTDTRIPSDLIEHLAPLSSVSLYLLQPLPATEKTSLSCSTLFHQCGAPFNYHTENDIKQLSGLIGSLDLIITQDSIIAHCAGAFGIPTLLILPPTSTYRWGNTSSSTPWYPSLTLIRRENNTSWEEVYQATVTYIQKSLKN